MIRLTRLALLLAVLSLPIACAPAYVDDGFGWDRTGGSVFGAYPQRFDDRFDDPRPRNRVYADELERQRRREQLYLERRRVEAREEARRDRLRRERRAEERRLAALREDRRREERRRDALREERLRERLAEDRRREDRRREAARREEERRESARERALRDRLRALREGRPLGEEESLERRQARQGIGLQETGRGN